MNFADDTRLILDRIATGTCTEQDIEDIRQLLLIADKEFISNLSKYNVQIGQGREVHIGDKITIECNEDILRALASIISPIGSTPVNNNDDTSDHLDAIKIDSNLINKVNQRLQLLESVYGRAELSDTQKYQLKNIQTQVRVVNELSERISTLSNEVERLLQNVRNNLTDELQRLKNQPSNPIFDRNNSKIELLETFITALDADRQAAKWVILTTLQLKQTGIKKALDEFPEIRDNATAKQLNDLDFSVGQYLEQISHALELGDFSIFDNSEIPLVLPSKFLYMNIFEQIKIIIKQRSLQTDVTSKIEECLDYVIHSIDLFN
jgi:Effector-associated domain 10